MANQRIRNMVANRLSKQPGVKNAGVPKVAINSMKGAGGLKGAGSTPKAAFNVKPMPNKAELVKAKQSKANDFSKYGPTSNGIGVGY